MTARSAAIRRARESLNGDRARDRATFRLFPGTVDAVDGTAKTAEVNGINYKYVETPTAIAVSDRVLVLRVGLGAGWIIARFP